MWNRAEPFLHRIDFADIAAGQHGQRAETDCAAQNPAPVDIVTSLRFSVRTRSSIGLLGRNSDGVQGRMVIVLLCQCEGSISETVLISGSGVLLTIGSILGLTGVAARGASSSNLSGGLSSTGPPLIMTS
jgi:hypothetical protein